MKASSDLLLYIVYCSRTFIKSFTTQSRLNSLPNNKFLGWPKLKALTEDKINVTEKLKFGLRRVGNIIRKGENAGYQHFLPFP